MDDDIFYHTEIIFAWRPVRLVGGRWAWLSKVRKQTMPRGPGVVLGQPTRYKSLRAVDGS